MYLPASEWRSQGWVLLAEVSCKVGGTVLGVWEKLPLQFDLWFRGGLGQWLASCGRGKVLC